MIDERQQEQASLYAAGALPDGERETFAGELRGNAELQQLVGGLQNSVSWLARTSPRRTPPAGLKERILRAIQPAPPAALSSPAPGVQFIKSSDSLDWKPLPVPGGWIKVLSVDRPHGYVVLLGKLEAGARYPAHTHTGSEDLFLLTGDLRVGGHVMRAGDFHHSDAGTTHEDNHSVEGCTLLAVVSADHALAKFAMA